MDKLRTPVVLLLFTSAAVVESFRLSSLSALSGNDIWLHLSTGLWIIQNHALPHTGIYSQSSNLPWIAATWLFDVKAAIHFKLFGLRVAPELLMFFKTSLAVLTFLLAGGLRGRFWTAVTISAVAQYVLGGVQPGPAYCSIIFFALELFVLLVTRQTGNGRLLFWLPPLCLFWANCDVQFVWGLALLLLFLASLAIEKSGVLPPVESNHGSPSLLTAGIAAVLCLIATLTTPYFYRPYGVFFSYFASAANEYLPDFHAMKFHQPQDYILLLLTMAAFLSLGLRRSRDPFLIPLLIGASILSFRAQRDIWLVTLASVSVLGQMIPNADEGDRSTDWHWARTVFVTAACAFVFLIVPILRLPSDRQPLLAKVGQTFPVAASDYIRAHNLPQPLFSVYEWGGFLTWSLPEYPVAIDGRMGLYSDDFVIQYSKAMNADIPYTNFPAMADARTLLLPKKSVMGQALSSVSGLKVAYSDDVAVVLTKE